MRDNIGRVLFSSVKRGSGNAIDDLGRWFTLYDEAQWAAHLRKAGLEVIEITGEPPSDGTAHGLGGPWVDLELGAPAVRIAPLLWLAPTLLLAAIPSAVAQSSPFVPGGEPKPSRPAAPVPPIPAAVEVSLREPIRLHSNPGLNPLWIAALSALAALTGALIGSWSTTRNARAAIIQKTNELEIDSIERRLTEFVGPFMQLSEENRIFAAELKRNQPGGADFLTLTALLTPGWLETLSTGDRHLLDAVVANGVALRKLIYEKGASAAPPELLPYFSKASAHFRFLELAATGSLDPDPARYSEYVYPRALDGVMTSLQLLLLARRQTLFAHPDEVLEPMGALRIAEELKLSAD